MENFRIIQVIYGTLIMGVVAFLIFTLFTIPMTSTDYYDGSNFAFLVPVFFILSVFLSSFLFNKSVSKIVKTDSLFQKLTKYQSAIIMRGAPLEGTGLMAVVATFTTSNYYYLIFTLLAIILMFIYFPSKYKFENTVELSLDEKNRLTQM